MGTSGPPGNWATTRPLLEAARSWLHQTEQSVHNPDAEPAAARTAAYICLNATMKALLASQGRPLPESLQLTLLELKGLAAPDIDRITALVQPIRPNADAPSGQDAGQDELDQLLALLQDVYQQTTAYIHQQFGTTEADLAPVTQKPP